MNASTDSASAAGFPPDSQIRERSPSFLSKRFLIPQTSAARNWEDPGPPSPTPTFPFSEVSLLNDSDHRQPGYRPDIWSLLTVHVSTMRFSNRVPELALVQSLVPSLKKRGHSHAGRVWIRPRSPQNNSSFVHTLGITKLQVVFRGDNRILKSNPGVVVWRYYNTAHLLPVLSLPSSFTSVGSLRTAPFV